MTGTVSGGDTFDCGLWLEGVRGWIETLDCCLFLKLGVQERFLGRFDSTYLVGIGRPRAQICH